MSDEKMVSERDAVMRERAAFFAGANWRYQQLDPIAKGTNCRFMDGDYHVAAANAFPLPEVTRPRVVQDPFAHPHQGWTFVAGEMMRTTRSLGGKTELVRCCQDAGTANWSWWVPNEKRLAVWADLLANPDEEVTDE